MIVVLNLPVGVAVTVTQVQTPSPAAQLALKALADSYRRELDTDRTRKHYPGSFDDNVAFRPMASRDTLTV